MARIISTEDLFNKKVIGGKAGDKRIGRVRYFVFHPREKVCVGFLVKRPDAAMMFHRKDVFVALDSYTINEEGRIVIADEKTGTDNGACKRLGLDLDSCVIWSGLPVVTKDEKLVGHVSEIYFDADSGAVHHLVLDAGAAAAAILGKIEVEAADVLGFRQGIGEALQEGRSALYDGDEEALRGAILVSDSVESAEATGGVAEKAGQATAIAAAQAKKVVRRVKPKAQEAAETAGDAVNAAAFATGRQIGRTKGLLSAFKEEYNKARYEED